METGCITSLTLLLLLLLLLLLFGWRPGVELAKPRRATNEGRRVLRSISEFPSCFLGPRPWHIEIRHRVKQTYTINLFGFETLKLKIRRLKLWKPTVRTPPRMLEPLAFSARHGSKNPGFYLRPLSPCAIASLGFASTTCLTHVFFKSGESCNKS